MLNQLQYNECQSDSISITKELGRFVLRESDFCWMTTYDIDLMDHEVIDSFSGNILLTGMGLGVGIVKASMNKNIGLITVIENNPDIIDLVWPEIKRNIQQFKSPVNLIVGDADSEKLIQSLPLYDYIFLDHAKEQILSETQYHYQQKIICWIEKRVFTWWEERQEIHRRLGWIPDGL